MLEVREYVYGKLNAATAVGMPLEGVNVVYGWPDEFLTLPIIAYDEDDQSDRSHHDNAVDAFESILNLNVVVGYTSNTTAIAKAVDTIMKADGWSLFSNGDNDVPGKKVRRRLMRYRKLIAESDLT